MNALALKLVLTPVLIGAASLVARRWGTAVSGWLVGLPFTSGPVVFFLALGHGTTFAASVAAGTLAGTISQAGFCLAYAWTDRDWPAAVLAGSLAFAAATAGLRLVSLPLAVIAVLVVLALLLTLGLMPRRAEVARLAVAPPWWDIPARMVVATGIVLLLTGLAPALGARLTGLLAPFPVYAAVLAVFAHQFQGRRAAGQVLRGLLLGLFGFAAFFLVLAALLERIGIAGAFSAALAAALVSQGVSLAVIRRNSWQNLA